MPDNRPSIVLLLGSAPNVLACRDWPRDPFNRIIAINNAWQVRTDWDYLALPDDFPEDRRPPALTPGQHIVTAEEYVPAQNWFGGFVYAGGTMAFTAAYWALDVLQPDVLAVLGCDMVYPASGATHFYGTGQPDPLRADITLRSLEAKSARLFLHAARNNCLCVNLSSAASRLMFPRARPQDLERLPSRLNGLDLSAMAPAESEESELAYFVESGRYWESTERFDPARIDALDGLWLDAFELATARSAA